MNKSECIILVLIYLMTLLIFIFHEIRQFKKERCVLKLYEFSKIYYYIVFFITPIFVYYMLYLGQMPVYQVSLYLSLDFSYCLIAYIFTIISFLMFKLGYKIKVKNIPKYNFSSRSINFSFSIFLILIIGIMSILIWTNVYGMPWDIFKYASAIRSGVVEIYNPFTFLKPFCYFVIYALFGFFVILKNNNFKFNILLILGIIISSLFSYIFIIANDGRMLFIIVIGTLILFFMNDSKIKIPFKNYVIIGIILLFFVGNMDNITYYIRNGVKSSSDESFSIFNIVVEEFSYVHSNIININYLKNNDYVNNYTFVSDIKNVFFAWVPTSLKYEGSQTLFAVNTSYVSAASGTLPTDIITASIFKFGYIGICILPLFVGYLVKKLDSYFLQQNDNYYIMLNKLLCIYLTLRLIAYYDLSNILSGALYIILSHIIIIIISHFTFKKRRGN